MSDSFVISAKALSLEQLVQIEARAIPRFNRMRAITPHMGNITLAVAALLIEMCDIALPDTQVYIIAQDDMRSIVRSYLSRHKLSPAFPYKNGQLLDYVGYADFTRVAACIG
jgi:hypothetical protein